MHLQGLLVIHNQQDRRKLYSIIFKFLLISFSSLVYSVIIGHWIIMRILGAASEVPFIVCVGINHSIAH